MRHTRYNPGWARKTAHNAKVFLRKALRRAKKYICLFSPVAKHSELKREKNTVFQGGVLFSILTPLYNTDKKMLKQMIKSVTDQTYSNWELCLADGSDGEHGYVGDICREYAEKDGRIKYAKIENKGISGNTNECFKLSSGDYIAMLDHDDILHPSALLEVMKVIERESADFIYTDETTFSGRPQHEVFKNYKPDFSPDLLRTVNYICHLSVFSRALLESAGAEWKSEFDGSQDYDMTLRLTEKAKEIVHIPKPLYFWRASTGSVASGVNAKPYAVIAAKKAVSEHLERLGLSGSVEDSAVPSMYRIRYSIAGNPKVSIIIPNKDHVDDLDKCLSSIWDKTTWQNYEIIVIENNSTEAKTFAYYDKLDDVRVIKYDGPFNYSSINNYAASEADGKYLLFLNNDTEVISPEWIQEMLMFAQRDDAGAVGAMLWYPDDTVQHAGVILGLGGIAGHWHAGIKRGDPGFMGRLAVVQNVSAVTGACLMVEKKKFKEAGEFSEELAVAFNDVDLCLKLREKGLLNVWTPYAELYHYESKSRGVENNREKVARFENEISVFADKWSRQLSAGDPYYNPNLSLKIDRYL